MTTILALFLDSVGTCLTCFPTNSFVIGARRARLWVLSGCSALIDARVRRHADAAEAAVQGAGQGEASRTLWQVPQLQVFGGCRRRDRRRAPLAQPAIPHRIDGCISAAARPHGVPDAAGLRRPIRRGACRAHRPLRPPPWLCLARARGVRFPGLITADRVALCCACVRARARRTAETATTARTSRNLVDQVRRLSRRARCLRRPCISPSLASVVPPLFSPMA